MPSTIGLENLRQALAQALVPSSYRGVVGPGSTTTSVVDSYGGWATDQWANYGIQFTADTATPALRGVWQKITGNTANTLTLAAALPATPAAGDTYNIRPFGSQVMDLQAWGQQNVAPPLDDNSDAVAAATGGLPRILARLTAWTGVAWSRLRLAASGSLQTKDDATGTTGGASPASAIQMAGSDGNSLRAIRVDASGYLLPANQQTAGPSTTTPLAASATYTSGTITAAGYARITGTVYADQSGTLYVEQSPDGVNWDVSSSFSVTGGTGLGFSVEVVAPNARLRYVNGATAQTAFRLYSWLRRVS